MTYVASRGTCSAVANKPIDHLIDQLIFEAIANRVADVEASTGQGVVRLHCSAVRDAVGGCRKEEQVRDSWRDRLFVLVVGKKQRTDP